MRPEQTLVKTPVNTLKDFLSPSGWELIRYRKAVQELDALITPFAPKMQGVGEEWETIVLREETRRGVGPSSVTLKAKYEGETLVLRLDHRREDYYSGERPMYGKPGERSFWSLYHRTTILRIKDGEIWSIATGRGERSDYYTDRNNPEYLSFATPEWKSFEPVLTGVTLLKGQTDTLRAMAKSLRAATDKYGIGLDEVS